MVAGEGRVRGGERVEEGQLRQRVAALTLNRGVWSSAWHRVLTVKSATTSAQNCASLFFTQAALLHVDSVAQVDARASGCGRSLSRMRQPR